jgi:serine/threonine-protein kinase RsbT
MSEMVVQELRDERAREALVISESGGREGAIIMPNGAVCETIVPIKHDADVLVAYHKGRAMAAQLGLSSDDQMVVVIAILEVARNIVRYAGMGEIVLSIVKQDGRGGIVVVARDSGPGIPNVERAMRDGYSTGGGLGLGLPGARRLMDEFKIVSEIGKGTTIEMKKWKR